MLVASWYCHISYAGLRIRIYREKRAKQGDDPGGECTEVCLTGVPVACHGRTCAAARVLSVMAAKKASSKALAREREAPVVSVRPNDVALVCSVAFRGRADHRAVSFSLCSVQAGDHGQGSESRTCGTGCPFCPRVSRPTARERRKRVSIGQESLYPGRVCGS